MTDAGGTPPGVGDGDSGKSAFEFDLGGALARLSGDAGDSDPVDDAPAPSTPETAAPPADRLGPPTDPSPAPPTPPLPSRTPEQAAPTSAAPPLPSRTPQPDAGREVSPTDAAPAPRGPDASGPPPASTPAPTPTSSPTPPPVAPTAGAVPTPSPATPPTPAPASMPATPPATTPSAAPAPTPATAPSAPAGAAASPVEPAPSPVAPDPRDARGGATEPAAPTGRTPEPGFTWTSTSAAGSPEGEQRVASLRWNEPLPSREPARSEPGDHDDRARSNGSGSSRLDHGSASPAASQPAGPNHHGSASPAASQPAGPGGSGSSWFDHGSASPAASQPAGPGGSGSWFDDASSRNGADPGGAGSYHTAAAAAAPPVESAPVERNYPRRVPGTHFDAQQPAAPAPTPQPAAAAPTTAPPAPAARQSVFDDGAAQYGGAASLPNAAAGAAPILPDVNPAAPPPVAEPAGNGPDNVDLTALRSAQLRQNKQQQRQGRLFGRSLLAFVLIGGVLAAGLFFGRSLLFPTEWDAQMTPIVNELQDTTGVEFEGTVPFVLLSPDEYAARLGITAVGNGWVERVPQWRALGLANGAIDADLVGATLGTTMAESATAFYDPSNETIYRSDSVEATGADLRMALTAALEHQQATAAEVDDEPSSDETTDEAMSEATADADAADSTETIVVSTPADEVLGFTGVSPLSDIATRAVDRLLVRGAADERQPASEELPVPIAYEVAAVDILGEPILASAGVDASTLQVGTPYPDSVTGALDDRPVETASALLQPGEVAVTPATALGTDDWSLVWSVGLPQPTVAALVDQVAADSYRAVERDGTVCVLGVFETLDELAGASVMASMTTWALNAPAAARAEAMQLSATRVQLTSCDPGTDAPFTPNPAVVDGLLDRQQQRLSN